MTQIYNIDNYLNLRRHLIEDPVAEIIRFPDSGAFVRFTEQNEALIKSQNDAAMEQVKVASERRTRTPAFAPVTVAQLIMENSYLGQ